MFNPSNSTTQARGGSTHTPEHESGWNSTRSATSSTSRQQPSSYTYLQPGPGSASSGQVHVNPTPYAFGHPASTLQNHTGFGRAGTNQAQTRAPTHPFVGGGYSNFLPATSQSSFPGPGYTAQTASSSGRQNAPHAQARQTISSSSRAQQASTSTSLQTQLASTQLRTVIRVVRDLSQDLHIDGFDEADPKGICQALNGLRECLAAAEETQQNVQLFIKLRAIIAKLTDSLAYLTNTTSPIQASRNKSVLKISGILGLLTDSKTGAPRLFAVSGEEYTRTNAMMAKLENLVNSMALQGHSGAPMAPPSSIKPHPRTKINLRGCEIKLGDASQPNADNSIGCFNQMSEGSTLEVHAPGFKLSAPSGALWSRNVIGGEPTATGTGQGHSGQGFQQAIHQGMQQGWNLQSQGSVGQRFASGSGGWR